MLSAEPVLGGLYAVCRCLLCCLPFRCETLACCHALHRLPCHNLLRSSTVCATLPCFVRSTIAVFTQHHTLLVPTMAILPTVFPSFGTLHYHTSLLLTINPWLAIVWHSSTASLRGGARQVLRERVRVGPHLSFGQGTIRPAAVAIYCCCYVFGS